MPAVLCLVGCAADEGVTEPGCADAPYVDPGPFVAGVTRLDVEGVLVEVWYPAPPDAEGPPDVYDMRDWLPEAMRSEIPVDAPTTFTSDAIREAPPARGDGPFPVVVFSHGLGGYRMQSTFLMTHLAEWGFVVVAPEHAERNLAAVLEADELRDDAVAQVNAAMARVASESDTAGALLEGMVDLERVALTAHSAGGGTLQVLADDPAFGAGAWVGLSTITAPSTELPGLLIAGTSDMIATPAAVERVYEDVPHPQKHYLAISGAGHLAFSDICTIGREQGGVLQIARDAGIEINELVLTLGTDGCGPEDLPAEEAWPLIRHYTTALLVDALGDGTGEVTGLEPDSNTCFDVVDTYRSPE